MAHFTGNASPARRPPEYRTPPRGLKRPGLEAKLRFLRDPRSYPDRPARVSTIETHFAWVFLIARDAVELPARGRRIAEGHGDLRAEHVCLAAPISVIDCLEFDRNLRLLDPAREMALLALEIAGWAMNRWPRNCGDASVEPAVSRSLRQLCISI